MWNVRLSSQPKQHGKARKIIMTVVEVGVAQVKPETGNGRPATKLFQVVVHISNLKGQLLQQRRTQGVPKTIQVSALCMKRCRVQIGKVFPAQAGYPYQVSRLGEVILPLVAVTEQERVKPRGGIG